ncbi:MAG: hypothetical protein QOF71_2562 [Candidatus Eremiobacteraeota bacterium]|nr:hypothetical protein [Candidatus Eremiobacteraeota bacterium]
MPEHRAHAILVPLFNTEQSLLERMATFTRVIAAFLSASGAVAINLGGAHATHEATFFVDIASIEEPLPAMLMIWNGISVAKDGDRVSLLSLGMAQLDLPDLLLTAPATAVNGALECMFDLLAYIASRAAPLPEGDTIGVRADDRHTVRYEPSPLADGTDVWCVDL